MSVGRLIRCVQMCFAYSELSQTSKMQLFRWNLLNMNRYFSFQTFTNYKISAPQKAATGGAL